MCVRARICVCVCMLRLWLLLPAYVPFYNCLNKWPVFMKLGMIVISLKAMLTSDIRATIEPFKWDLGSQERQILKLQCYGMSRHVVWNTITNSSAELATSICWVKDVTSCSLREVAWSSVLQYGTTCLPDHMSQKSIILIMPCMWAMNMYVTPNSNKAYNTW
jgi:hypothetical protein